MIRIYVPAPSEPPRFTLLTPFQLVAMLAYFASIPVVTAILFPIGG